MRQWTETHEHLLERETEPSQLRVAADQTTHQSGGPGISKPPAHAAPAPAEAPAATQLLVSWRDRDTAVMWPG
jgi:hypothetical protein